MWVRRLLATIESILLWLLLVPVAVIAADGVLVYLEARPENALVAFFADSAELLMPLPVRGLLSGQTHWQTAALGVAAYVAVGVLFVVLFGLLRRLAAAMEQEDEPAADS